MLWFPSLPHIAHFSIQLASFLAVRLFTRKTKKSINNGWWTKRWHWHLWEVQPLSQKWTLICTQVCFCAMELCNVKVCRYAWVEGGDRKHYSCSDPGDCNKEADQISFRQKCVLHQWTTTVSSSRDPQHMRFSSSPFTQSPPGQVKPVMSLV